MDTEQAIPPETLVSTRPYIEDSDYDTMLQWLSERKAYLPPKAEMPKIGIVAMVYGERVAMGFLRAVEGGLCQLDGLVTNPNKTSTERDLAIRIIVPALLETAKANNFARVYAFTTVNSLMGRAFGEYGFVAAPHIVMVKS